MKMRMAKTMRMRKLMTMRMRMSKTMRMRKTMTKTMWTIMTMKLIVFLVWQKKKKTTNDCF